jgi:phenylalanyl-tRNA synthetase beta chain
MRVPLSWLKEYVNITLSPDHLAEKLTIAGLEVTDREYIGVPGGNDPERLVWDREKLVIGQILKVEQHPDADRLVLATVEHGGDEPEVVVTGAPNLFEYLGQGDLSEQGLYSPFVMEGAEVYDGHKEGQVKMRLKGRKLRGIFNRCMLCSEKELGLSEEHEGIMIMPGSWTPGTPLQDVLGDVVFEIDIIPNIARCASIIGVAREVAALTGQQVRYPDYSVLMEGPDATQMVRLSTDEPELNPRFVAMVIRGVEQKPSPPWMQRRLRLAGQRPINVVVDVSNYVMLEIGQPNHTFDYDFLRKRADQYAGPDSPIHIHTRLPDEGETLTTLDGVTHKLLPETILVTDPAGNLSLGGIMGGLESEIGDETTDVLLEAAAWNFINIRRSAHTLKINSEAGFRFSRGVHPSQALLGAKRAAELLRKLAGGIVDKGIVDYYPNPPEMPQIELTTQEVARIGGIQLAQDEIAGYLTALEFGVENKGDHLLVTPPDHRLDISGSHDLVEEVCRMYGYDRIPTTVMDDVLPPQRGNLELEKEERVRDILSAQGLQEVITYRLTTPEQEARLLPRSAKLPPDDRPYVTLANPINQDRVAMRHSLLSSVLEIAASNSRYRERLALFEVGQVFLASEASALPDELLRLAIVLAGPRQLSHWQWGGESSANDFFDLKGIVEELLAQLGLEGLEMRAASHPSWRPGRTARLWLGDAHAGWLGELHPLVVEQHGIRTDDSVLAAELNLALLLDHVPEQKLVEPTSPFPAVIEDLALVVDKGLPAATVENELWRAGGFLLKNVELFDVYEGEQIASGKKSLAYHLTFQSPNKTLKDKDTQNLRSSILKKLREKIGAELR